MASPSQYWAAAPVEDAAAEWDSRIGKWYESIRANGLLALWRNAFRSKYAGIRTRGRLQQDGESGELTTVELNDYGNLLQHSLTLVTGQRPAFEAKAKNSDHRSQTQCIIANGLIETVMRERDLEGGAQIAAARCQEYGEGWLLKLWDATLGPDYRPDPDTGAIVKGGDVVFHSLTPADVPRDPTKDSTDDSLWFAPRLYENRWNLTARYPELEDKILGLPNKLEKESDRMRIVPPNWQRNTTITESDDVAVYHCLHDRCDAIPDGRYMIMCAPDVVLFDGPLPYPEMPLYRMSVEDVDCTTIGYTNFFDLLAPQQALNATASNVVSNEAAFGTQNIWVPAGGNLTLKALAGGLNLLEGGTQPPQPLNLLATKQETFTLLSLLQRAMETLSGINSVARGNPEASLKSGAALALVQAQAIQFVALLQKAYIRFLERVATGTLLDYQQKGSAPRAITLAGQANREYVKEFTAQDISEVSRVTIQVANPLSATIAGRYNLAEMMLQNGLVKTPEQLQMVMTTGRLEPVTEGTQRELLNIRSENERLANGEECQVMITDNHPLHLRENSSVLDSPEAREDPKVAEAVTAHLAQHEQLWVQATQESPMLLAAKGIPPAPMPQPSAPPPGMGPPGPPGTPPPGEPGLGPPGKGAPPAPMPGSPPGKMPFMPTNPLTHERAPGPISPMTG